jgi:PAS domain S-box-containing protein
MINNEGNITFWNEASCNIFGYSQEEILGKNLHDLIAPVRFLDEHRKAFHLFKTSGKGAAIGKTLELRAIRKGGQEFPIELSLSAINLKDQWHAVGIIHDISVRKQAESEVRKLSTAIEQSPVSIVITNLEGNIEYANPKACETTGYLLDELVGKNPRVLKSGETKSNEYELLWTSITSGKHWKGIFHNKKKNGELYWESSTIGPITDSNGKITHYLALKEDITERRKVEKALQDSEALLRSFFDLPLIGHAITSLEKGWLEVNASLCNMLGYTKAELLPMTWDELTHPDDLAGDIAQFNRVMAGETDGYAIEKRFICRDGHFIDTHMAVQCNRNADLSINYFMAVIVDISDRKKIENQLKQMAEQLSLANEDLVRVNAEKDRFFSIIAHDLRSPFGAFLNLTRLMAEDLNNLSLVKIQKLATTMSKSAAKLYDMLENLLEWSRMQRGITTFEPENMILKNKINSFIQVHCESANDKQININIDVPDNLHVYADERMLQSTIRNLLSNAIKFTPKGGQITIGAVSDLDQPVVVSMRDSGIGMNQKMVDNLFRIDENVSRPGTEGESSSGLGLLLCKDFIEKHGGRIWVESEVNKGTVFCFTLPKKSDEQE